MRSSKRRLVWLVALLMSVGFVAAACGSDSEGGSSTTTSDSGSGSPQASGGCEGYDYKSLSGKLTLGGASFPEAYYSAAIAKWQDEDSGLDLGVYEATGSSTGKQRMADGLFDAAGSDSLVKDGTFSKPFFYFPTVAAPITVSYNLDGVDELKLSPSALGGIFSGSITTWDAEEIKADNPDADLPSEAITLVVRSDGSGTTNNFSTYLSLAAPDTFTLEPGDQVQWPQAQAGNGNGGVAQLINTTSGSIGYVDLADADATGLSYADIQNKDGEFVAPTLEAVSAALDGAEVKDDLTYQPLNAAGAESYPIAAPTYYLTYQSYADQTMTNNVKGWLCWILNDAQDQAEAAGFAQLPDSLREKADAQVEKITTG